MIARIIVTPKKSVLDPQGEAVRRAIHSLGFDAVASARIGKYIELEVSATNPELVRKKLDEIAGDLLSNPVVEDYALELVGAAPASPSPTKAAIATAIKAIKAEPEPKVVAAKAKAKTAAIPVPVKVKAVKVQAVKTPAKAAPAKKAAAPKAKAKVKKK